MALLIGLLGVVHNQTARDDQSHNEQRDENSQHACVAHFPTDTVATLATQAKAIVIITHLSQGGGRRPVLALL